MSAQSASRSLDFWRIAPVSGPELWEYPESQADHEVDDRTPIVEDVDASRDLALPREGIDLGAEAVAQFEFPAGNAPMVLSIGTSVSQIKERLQALGGPIYGTKAELYKRLQLYENRLIQTQQRDIFLNERHEAIVQRRQPRIPLMLAVTVRPSEEVVAQQEARCHLPWAKWCEICVRASAEDDPHRR